MVCTGCGEDTFKTAVLPGKGDFCKRCAPVARHVPHAVFPFTSDHISSKAGHPVEVNSLHHLRQLEKQYGVSSVAFNTDSANFNAPPSTDFRKITPWLHGESRIYPHTEESAAMERRMGRRR